MELKNHYKLCVAVVFQLFFLSISNFGDKKICFNFPVEQEKGLFLLQI